MIAALVLLACSYSSLDASVDPSSGIATVVAGTGDAALLREGRPIAGRRSPDGRTFVSAGPLQPGVAYVASDGQEDVVLVRPAPAPGPPPTVEVAPRVDAVPANHLKLHLRFSRPMRQPDDLFDRLTLLDETTGEIVEDAFHELANWDRDGRHLTLLLHPGRQKRGIGFARDVGPVLQPGHRYALVVPAGLEATDGVASTAEVVHRFTALPADRRSPDPAAWTVTPPASRSAELVVTLDEPAEPRLLRTAFGVHDARGNTLQVDTELMPGGDAVALRPAGHWPAEMTVVQTGRVEDLAGNTPGRTFDHATGEVDDAAAFRVTVRPEG